MGKHLVYKTIEKTQIYKKNQFTLDLTKTKRHGQVDLHRHQIAEPT